MSATRIQCNHRARRRAARTDSVATGLAMRRTYGAVTGNVSCAEWASGARSQGRIWTPPPSSLSSTQSGGEGRGEEEGGEDADALGGQPLSQTLSPRFAAGRGGALPGAVPR
jgi:hypothetical protein